MDFKAIESIVSKFAPVLGSAISASNPLAGLIIMAITREFGGNSDANSITSAIQSDPNAQAKLHEIELDHQDAIYQYQAKDQANARSREEEIVRLTGKRDSILDFIAIMVIVGFFGLCLINYFVKLEDDHIMTLLTGYLSSGFMLCLSYYFGSSNKP